MPGIAYGESNAAGLPPVNLPSLDDGGSKPLQITISKPSPAAPVFDSSKPFTIEGGADVASAAAPQFDPTKPFTVDAQAPTVSTGDAAITGLKSGLTAGFSDELGGLNDAALTGLPPDVVKGVTDHLSPVGKLLAAGAGGARVGLEAIFGGDDAKKAYQAGRDRIRALQQAARAQHPIATGAGEIAGALATIPMAPGLTVAKGGGVAARIANASLTGAGYGGLFGAGEGEGAEDTARRAIAGAETGGIGGAIAAPLAEAGGKVISAVTKPFKAGVNPTGEAARRVAGAFERDRPGTTLDHVANALEAANNAGEPVIAADLGKETTRALARSSANTSPEGRDALQIATSPRFQDQGQRIADDIHWVIGGHPDATGIREGIQDIARRSNKPMYARAYAQGDRPIFNPELERLSASPTIQAAARAAEKKWKDWQVIDGFGASNPPIRVENGGILKFGGKGLETYPNIQYWDYVGRELKGLTQAAARSGNRQEAARFGGLEKQLKAALDKEVPIFSQARSGAARFFKADDALTAGEEFMTSKMSNSEARQALSKMTPEERTAFGFGFASQLLKAIAEVPIKDRSTVATKAFLNSPAARERIEMALGPNGARRLEARVRLETMMEQTRAAVAGNSTTARQLIEAGLAGSVGYGITTGDLNPEHLSAAAITGAMLRGASRQIDARVARKVGELLATNDPKIIREAAEMVAKNPRLMDGVRRTDAFVSRVLGVTQPNAPRLLPAPMASRADDQNKPGE